jgi:hypothetical protein
MHKYIFVIYQEKSKLPFRPLGGGEEAKQPQPPFSKIKQNIKVKGKKEILFEGMHNHLVYHYVFRPQLLYLRASLRSL